MKEGLTLIAMVVIGVLSFMMLTGATKPLDEKTISFFIGCFIVRALAQDAKPKNRKES